MHSFIKHLYMENPCMMNHSQHLLQHSLNTSLSSLTTLPTSSPPHSPVYPASMTLATARTRSCPSATPSSANPTNTSSRRGLSFHCPVMVSWKVEKSALLISFFDWVVFFSDFIELKTYFQIITNNCFQKY